MQGTNIFSEKVLCKACRILFGPGIQFSREFLHYIQPSGIKRAYYKQAKLVHPDLQQDTDRMLNAGFRNLNKAFHILEKYIKARDYLPGAHQNNRTSSQEQTDHFYTGRLPARALRFGQFLYYSGIISWKILIQAIMWQRKKRVSMGELAIYTGLLKSDQVHYILGKKKLFEFFGETAIKLGFLCDEDIRCLLQKQLALGPRLGSYFLHYNHIPEEKFYSYLADHKKHNYLYKGIRR
jgi:hypothetical protein